MLALIKKSLPKPLKKVLIAIKSKTIDSYQKKKLAKRMQVKHQELLACLKGKEKIRVVFLAIHKSVWKVDTVFQRMLADPYFEPEILVCPYTPYGEERMLEDMEQAYSYFKDKGYPVKKTLNNDGSWVKLEEVQPDIVFFTNPHNLTRKEYYEDAYLNYLSCYVPYAHDVSKYNNYISQYNQFFHNAMWKIFVPHHEDLDIFFSYSQSKGNNVIVTGYPSCEVFFEDKGNSPWKPQDKDKLKIIWAPHHTIDDPNLPYSNFLRLADFFKRISFEFKNEVQFSFKPHPILKSKLSAHPDWGVEKTSQYYSFWEESDSTQLEEGDYIELFKWSDCMIHDSGSFLAEYHYVKKPVFYISDKKTENYLNPFGIAALNCCLVGENEESIREFIKKMLLKKVQPDLEFFDKKLKPFFVNRKPSKSITLDIQKNIN